MGMLIFYEFVYKGFLIINVLHPFYYQTVRKRSIRVTIGDFLVPCDLAIWRIPWKTIGHLFYVASSFVHHSIAISEFWLELQSGNAQFGSKLMFFVSCDLKIWCLTLKNDRTHLLSNIKLCASFHRHHMWIETGVTVRKEFSWVLTSATLTFDLWPWPFAWTSLRSLVITPKVSRWNDDASTVKKVWQTERRT